MEFKENNPVVQRMREWHDRIPTSRENLIIDTIHGINIVELLSLMSKEEDYNVIVFGDYYKNIFDYYRKPYFYMCRDKELNDMDKVIDFINEKYITVVVGLNFLDYDNYLSILNHSTNRFMFIGDSYLPKFKDSQVNWNNGTIKFDEVFAHLMLSKTDLVLNTLNKIPSTVQDLVYLTNRFRKGQTDLLEESSKPSYCIREGFELTPDEMLRHDITIVSPSLVNKYNREYRIENLLANDYHIKNNEVLIFNKPFIIEHNGRDIKIETGTRFIVHEVKFITNTHTAVIGCLNDFNTTEDMLTFTIYNPSLSNRFDDDVEVNIPFGSPDVSYGYVTSLDKVVNKIFESVLIDAYMETKTRYCYTALRLALKRATIVYKDNIIY